MPVLLPSSGYDAANWSATAARLNAEQAVWPSLPDDGGGRFMARLGNSFGAVAISPDQFATSSHIAPRASTSPDEDHGSVEFAGRWWKIIGSWHNGDFAIIKVTGRLPRWCPINFTPPNPGDELIAWGYGRGYKPGDAPYVKNGVMVFPTWDEGRALRWAKMQYYAPWTGGELRCMAFIGDPIASGTILGGDSGGGLFKLNSKTQRVELVGTHWQSYTIDNHPHDRQLSVHSSTHVRADWIRGLLTADTAPDPEPVPVWPPAEVRLSISRLSLAA